MAKKKDPRPSRRTLPKKKRKVSLPPAKKWHPTGRIYDQDPLRNFRFLVKIQPYSQGGWDKDAFGAHLGFTSVTGMSLTMTSIPLVEGGINTLTHQLPGLVSYSPLTFQTGTFLGNNENWEWIRRIIGTVGNAGYGAPGGNFRCRMRIDVLSHPNPGSRATQDGRARTMQGSGYYADSDDIFGTEADDDHSALSFHLSKAWITTLSYSDLNAGDNALLVQQMTVVHEGMHLAYAGDYSKSSRKFPPVWG